MFQSTPVIADGRTSATSLRPVGMPGFNPRPSSLTGELGVSHFFIDSLMFQSTPVIADGRTDFLKDLHNDWKVSIHARHR